MRSGGGDRSFVMTCDRYSMKAAPPKASWSPTGSPSEGSKSAASCRDPGEKRLVFPAGREINSRSYRPRPARGGTVAPSRTKNADAMHMPKKNVSSRFRPLQVNLAPSVQKWGQEYLDRGQPDGEEGAISELTDAIIEDAVRERVTDIHLEPEESLLCMRFRVDGVLHDVFLFAEDVGHRLLGHIKAMAQIDPIPLRRPADGRATHKKGGMDLVLRVACVPAIAGEKLAVRLLDAHRLELSLNELGLTEAHHSTIERWLDSVCGMFLVVGATGSGKTTTLYALLHELKVLHQSVVTIEDPVEYGIPGITQMQLNERSGPTFAEGVKAMLRLDPDFLLLGEIRDVPSAHAAIDASATGKTVLSTLHSRDTAGAITSLRNFHLQDYEIATALEVVVAQKLVRKLCRHCRKEARPTTAERKWLDSAGMEIPPKVWKPEGCEHCRNTGYLGRTALFQVWHLNDTFRQLILDHANEGQLRQELSNAGINTIIHDGVEKARKGITSLAELQRAGV